MRISIITCILSLLTLSMLLPASASLVGTAGLPWSPTESTNEPGLSPSPAAVSNITKLDPGPLVISSNAALDPVTAASINSTVMDMAWSPVMDSDLSPFQDISSLGGATVEVKPIDKILSSIMGTIPLGAIISGDMGWSF
jgi:hypothetical protein